MWVIILWLLGAFREYEIDNDLEEENSTEHSTGVNIILHLLYLLWPFVAVYSIYMLIREKLQI